ncbi:OsmC/Ohr family protein [Enterococcus faecalis DENG1]|nr:OsmC/Ohr family protein [Enterococcus faecalis DENG1]
MSVPEAFQERATRCLKLVSPNCPVIQSLAERITVEETVVFKK